MFTSIDMKICLDKHDADVHFNRYENMP
jgi:hypothetical protein